MATSTASTPMDPTAVYVCNFPWKKGSTKALLLLSFHESYY